MVLQISAKEEDTKIQPSLETVTAKADINTIPTGNTVESSSKTLGVRYSIFLCVDLEVLQLI